MPVQDEVPVRIVGSRPTYAELDAQDESRVATVVRSELLATTDAEYHRVDARIVRRENGNPTYLVAYMLRKDIYLAEVVRVDVDSNYRVRGVTYGYDDSGEGDEDEEDGGGDAGWRDDPEVESGLGEGADNELEDRHGTSGYGVEFVVATPVPEITSAQAAVDAIYDLATEAGLQTVRLQGDQATVRNYKAYLVSGVRGFVNIGHGNPNSIVLADGTLSSSWFNGLQGTPLASMVVYFNSCQVFNDPLKTAVMDSGARTLIGGITNLIIGSSEQVCTCFWTKTLTTPQGMGPSLTTCERELYPSEGAHGIDGDLGSFEAARSKLVRAMWTHGHNMKVEHPERLSMFRPYGHYARIRGRDFTSTWLHFEIPTPVVVDSKRLQVDCVRVRLRTGPGARVRAVHVWDGERRIAAHNGLDLAPKSFASPRFGVPNRPLVWRGIGVSIGVGFGDSVNLPDTKLLVDVASVGCDFV